MRLDWKIRLKRLHSLPGYTDLKVEKRAILQRGNSRWEEIYQSAIASTEPYPEHKEFLLPIGFRVRDAIKEHALSTSRAYDKVKDQLDLTTSQNVRRMYARYNKSWNWDINRNTDEWVKVAEQWHAKHGKLPIPKWFHDNGYAGLETQLREHPERFAHLEQTKHTKTLTEWVKIAETLAAENNGVLPSISKCAKKGFRRLGGVIWSHREAFAHIPRAKNTNTTAEWVEIAKKVAAEHGGLPTNRELCLLGHFGLARAIQRKKSAFADIPKHEYALPIPPQASDEMAKAVALAEELARNNGGLLPSSTWLKRNGHNPLLHKMSIDKNRFAHLKQERYKAQSKAFTEWVASAEGLISQC